MKYIKFNKQEFRGQKGLIFRPFDSSPEYVMEVYANDIAKEPVFMIRCLYSYEPGHGIEFAWKLPERGKYKTAVTTQFFEMPGVYDLDYADVYLSNELNRFLTDFLGQHGLSH